MEYAAKPLRVCGTAFRATQMRIAALRKAAEFFCHAHSEKVVCAGRLFAKREEEARF
jgi:hypothetical protein